MKMLPLLSLLLTASISVHAAPEPAQPKLVLVLVVDGLPQEQVVRYRDQFGQGGFRRLLEQGAWFSNAHQAHGVTVTAIGHAAILTGAYPYQHGIIGNNWLDPVTRAQIYCTEDAAHHYIGEHTDRSDGTSPAKLRVGTLGDELRYATGERAKVLTVSGKDRGAILLAGKTGTAYMFMNESGNFASSTYYMPSHPQWVQTYNAAKPQDRYYGKSWKPMLADAAYAGDTQDYTAQANNGHPADFPFHYFSDSGKPDAAYYERLKVGPAVDELTLDFARAAVEAEGLGKNPAGVPDLLGVSLSGHDYINHRYGPESKFSHDHIQRLDRMLAKFFSYLDKRIGMDNVLVVLTADHGFPNTPEFSRSRKFDASRLDAKKMLAALNQHLEGKFGSANLVAASMLPNIAFNEVLVDKAGLKRADLEPVAARFLLDYPGIADVFTRTQFEGGGMQETRMGLLYRRAFHRQLSGDLMIAGKPYWYYSTSTSGTSHGSPYAYDTNVPLMIMNKRLIKPGAYGQYAEVVDIAPTLAHLLRVRPPAAAEGRVLVESLR
jgi:predicted AlkP superfamily pyrophosphatase or phosphodiesterase